ncbi:hypothetical protein ACOCEA_01435 [Maribacter sp. CXY002]|uniref:hypothetical protein n=1 Tax=Maribacter luteocoastalis TaxID=3407671 RepID=UPI003B677508
MKLMFVKRITKKEKRYTKSMGILYTNVTYINKKLLGITLSTIQKYRNTYYGEIKDCKACELSK